MDMTPGASYEHTQRSSLVPLLFGGIGLATLAILFLPSLHDMPLGPRLLLGATGIALMGSGYVFSTLTVRVADGALAWHFGPGAFRKSVPLASVAKAEETTTSAIEGWGIHLTMRGWLYNVSGRKAVLVTLRDRTGFLLGSDEPDALVRALGQLGPADRPATNR
ncbi:MAG: hypothetical protein ABIY52_07855 [Gemmatimonadaceae bacterium]